MRTDSVVTASSEWTRKALGATGNAAAAIVDGRGYVPLGPRHAALAVRAAARQRLGRSPGAAALRARRQRSAAR